MQTGSKNPFIFFPDILPEAWHNISNTYITQKIYTMNEQKQDSNSEENRYNDTDKAKNKQPVTVNKSGIVEDTSAIYLTENSNLQSPKEFKSDKEGDHSNDDEEITVSENSDEPTTAAIFAEDQSKERTGIDTDDNTQLNKGLEDQDIEKY